MATIGLDKLYYAKITESEDGEETYGLPAQLAKAIKADLSIELAEAVLYADDGAAEVIKDFKSGTLSLGVDDIGVTAAQDLTGAITDDNGVLISASENTGVPVAVGFRAMKPDGKYRYFWLYKVKFSIPATNLQTKPWCWHKPDRCDVGRQERRSLQRNTGVLLSRYRDRS
jgi:phi13 family phage major tail protein